MTQKYLQGLCDVGGTGKIDTSWDGGCGQFEVKDNPLTLPPNCPKVCGNCAYFSVAEFEIYPEQIVGEGMSVGRVA